MVKRPKLNGWLVSSNPPANFERGAVMIEMSIVVPILLFLVGAVIEFGNYLVTYQRITQAVREGVRVAESIPGMEPNLGTGASCYHVRNWTGTLDTSTGTCTNSWGIMATGAAAPKHELVLQRVLFILRTAGALRIEPDFELKFAKVFGGNATVGLGTSPVPKSVRVWLQVSYRPIFFPWNLTISQEAIGTYLYRT